MTPFPYPALVLLTLLVIVAPPFARSFGPPPSSPSVAEQVCPALPAPPAVSHFQATAPATSPYAGDLLIEEEVRVTLNTTPHEVCNSVAGQLRSWFCYLEEAEADATIYRGGSAVSSVTGAEYCDACALGPIPNGDSRSTYLVLASSTAAARCICGVL